MMNWENNGTVYVYIMSWQFDSGECGQTVEVFYSLEDAFELMRDNMNDARIDMQYMTTEEDDYQEGDMSWSIWEKGEYCYNHIDINIYEKAIR